MGQTIDGQIESLNVPKEGRVRISVAHLVPDISLNTSWMDSFPFAVLSEGAHKKGVKRFDALGGAINLKDEGIRQMISFGFKAEDFEYDHSSGLNDARFTVPVEEVKNVLLWFSNLENGTHGYFFETTPNREAQGELTQRKFTEFNPIVSRCSNEWCKVRYEYLGVVIQPPPVSGRGTSTRGAGVTTFRLFHGWLMVASNVIYDEMKSSEQIVYLKPEEIASTNGGSQKGHLSDGTQLADNLGLKYI